MHIKIMELSIEVSSAITFGRVLHVILHPRAYGLLHRIGPAIHPLCKLKPRK